MEPREAMEALEAAARELDAVRRFVSVGLDLSRTNSGAGSAPGARRLAFSEAEERALEDKVGAGIRAFERALERAREWQKEERTADAETSESVARHEQQLRRRTVDCRKLLVMYRQRAKTERLERARGSLMTGGGAKKPTEKNAGSAADATAALKRTKQAMSQEIERVASVSRVLDDGRVSLQSTREEFGGVQAELASVRRRLKALQWQAQQDRLWIGAGVAVLAATVLFIVYERTGLLLI